MDKFTIQVTSDGEMYNFDIVDYAHNEDYKCKFEVFKGPDFIASFEPDAQGILHICKNTGKANEALLYSIADKLEGHNL